MYPERSSALSRYIPTGKKTFYLALIWERASMGTLSLSKMLKISKLSWDCFLSFFWPGTCVVGECLIWEKFLIKERFFGRSKAILACSDIFHLMLVILRCFFIYPFFQNYIPTMPRRIVLGLLLFHCSFLMSGIAGNIL